MKHQREWYIPKQYSARITSKTVPGLEVYLTESDGRPYAVGFVGKAGKPAFNFRFRSDERRAAYIAEFIKAQRERAERTAKRRKERNEFQHTLKVGDVLRHSWGYEQTNIDYFEVVAVIGKMVDIRPIAYGASEETAWMQGKCIPAPGQYTGPAMRKRVQEGNAVKIHSWGSYAHPVTPRVIAGAKVYSADHWTAYH